MTLLSEIYDVTLKRGNRGANKLGWVRPTIGEFFVTHKDFNFQMVRRDPIGYTENVCVGGTVSASRGDTPEKAFDGSAVPNYAAWSYDTWHFHTLPGTSEWIQYQFPEAKRIVKLGMCNSRTTNGVEGVASFILYGSNDGETFTEITSGSRQNASYDGFEYFTFSNYESYLIYRFQVVFYVGNGGDGACLFELQLMEGLYE